MAASNAAIDEAEESVRAYINSGASGEIPEENRRRALLWLEIIAELRAYRRGLSPWGEVVELADPEPVTAAEIGLFLLHARAFLAREPGDRNTGPGRYEAEVGIRLAEEVLVLRAWRHDAEDQMSRGVA